MLSNAVDPIKVLVYGWKLVDYPEKLGPEGQFYSPIIWESVTDIFMYCKASIDKEYLTINYVKK